MGGNKGNIGKFNRGRGRAGADYQIIMDNDGNTMNTGNTGNNGTTNNNSPAGGDNEDIIDKLKEILEDLETIKDNTDDDDDDDDDTVTAQVSRSGADYTGNSGISFGNGRIRRNRNNVIVKQPGSDYLSFRV